MLFWVLSERDGQPRGNTLAAENPIIALLADIAGAHHVGDLSGTAPDRLARPLYGTALAVVKPGSTAEVSRILALAHEHSIPVAPQGGNTGLCGGATPDQSGKAIILSLGRMNTIRHLDTMSRTITIEAGCGLENIQQAAEAEDPYFRSISAPAEAARSAAPFPPMPAGLTLSVTAIPAASVSGLRLWRPTGG